MAQPRRRPAKIAGVDVPDWFDGSNAAMQRLNTEGKTDVFAAITFAQNQSVVIHPEDFPQANVDYSTAFLAKNTTQTAASYGSGFAQQNTGVISQVADFAKEYGKELVTAVTDPAQAIADVQNAIAGPAAVKADPAGFATVAVVGVALGVAVFYGWKHFKKGGK